MVFAADAAAAQIVDEGESVEDEELRIPRAVPQLSSLTLQLQRIILLGIMLVQMLLHHQAVGIRATLKPTVHP